MEHVTNEWSIWERNKSSDKGTDRIKGGLEHLEEVCSTWEWYRATREPCSAICWRDGPRRMLLCQEHSFLCHYAHSCAMRSPLMPWGYSCWAMTYALLPCMAFLCHLSSCCAKVVLLLQSWCSYATLEACCAIMVQDGPSWSLMSQVCYEVLYDAQDGRMF